MAVLNRILSYIILMLIELHLQLASAQTTLTKQELCSHLAAGTLCTDVLGQSTFPNPDDCKTFYTCERGNLMTKPCFFSSFDYIDLVCKSGSADIRCMTSCDVSTTVNTTLSTAKIAATTSSAITGVTSSPTATAESVLSTLADKTSTTTSNQITTEDDVTSGDINMTSLSTSDEKNSGMLTTASPLSTLSTSGTSPHSTSTKVISANTDKGESTVPSTMQTTPGRQTSTSSAQQTDSHTTASLSSRELTSATGVVDQTSTPSLKDLSTGPQTKAHPTTSEGSDLGRLVDIYSNYAETLTTKGTTFSATLSRTLRLSPSTESPNIGGGGGWNFHTPKETSFSTTSAPVFTSTTTSMLSPVLSTTRKIPTSTKGWIFPKTRRPATNVPTSTTQSLAQSTTASVINRESSIESRSNDSFPTISVPVNTMYANTSPDYYKSHKSDGNYTMNTTFIENQTEVFDRNISKFVTERPGVYNSDTGDGTTVFDTTGDGNMYSYNTGVTPNLGNNPKDSDQFSGDSAFMFESVHTTVSYSGNGGNLVTTDNELIVTPYKEANNNSKVETDQKLTTKLPASRNDKHCTLQVPCEPHKRIGDPTDCAKYFECNPEGTEWIEMKCVWLPLVHFDIVTKKCEQNDYATCETGCPEFTTERTNIDTTTVPPAVIETTTSLTNAGEGEKMSTSDDSQQCQLPIPCDPGTKLGDKYDCSKYYECDQGGDEWKEYKCSWSPFRYFDTDTNECQEKQYATCKTDCLGSIVSSTTPDTVTPPMKMYSNSGKDVITPMEASTISPNYRTVAGTTKLSVKETSLPETKTTTKGSIDTEVPFVGDDQQCILNIPCEPGERVGNQNDCSKYYQCKQDGTEWMEYKCSWFPFTFFDTETKGCLQEQYATCEMGCPGTKIETPNANPQTTESISSSDKNSRQHEMTTGTSTNKTIKPSVERTAITLIKSNITTQNIYETSSLVTNLPYSVNDKDCTLEIPCEPGETAGDKNDCTKYYECNKDGNEWREYKCSWIPFTFYDTQTRECKQEQYATCETQCPGTISQTTEVPPSSTITMATSGNNSENDDRMHTSDNDLECVLQFPCEPEKRVGDKDDCSIYFECNQDGNEWMEYECSWFPFRFFDTDTGVCKSEQDATCESGCPDSITVKPNATHGIFSSITTSEKRFVTSIETSSASSTHRLPSVTDTITVGKSTTLETLNDSTESNVTTQHTDDVSSLLVTELPFSGDDRQCTLPLPCDSGKRVGDKNDCSRYYECKQDGTEWMEYECSWFPFRFFDTETEVCKSEQDATCESGCPGSITVKPNVTHGISSTTTPEKRFVTSIETSSASSTHFSGDDRQCTLPLPCESGKRVGDKDDCSKYYECKPDGTEWMEYECSWFPFRFFDTETEVCKSKQDATCESGCPGSITVKPNVTHGISSTITPEKRFVTSIETSSVSSTHFSGDDRQCTLPLPCESGKRVGDKDDCSKYYECKPDGTEWMEYECSWFPFRFFDTETEVCKSKQDATCESGCPGSITVKPNVTHGISSTTTPGKRFVTSIETSSVSSTHFSGDDRQCTLPLLCESGKRVGDKDDCSKYYECKPDGTEWMEYECSWFPFRFFDTETNRCKQEEDATCETGCPVSNTETASGDLSTISPTAFVTDFPHSQAVTTNVTSSGDEVISIENVAANFTPNKTIDVTMPSVGETIVSGSSETTAQLPTDMPFKKEVCTLPLPCTPAQRVANTEDCQKYFLCNSSGSGWSEQACLWNPFRYFDSQTGFCQTESLAVCQTDCPSTSVPETTTTAFSVTTAKEMLPATTTEQVSPTSLKVTSTTSVFSVTTAKEMLSATTKVSPTSTVTSTTSENVTTTTTPGLSTITEKETTVADGTSTTLSDQTSSGAINITQMATANESNGTVSTKSVAVNTTVSSSFPVTSSYIKNITGIGEVTSVIDDTTLDIESRTTEMPKDNSTSSHLENTTYSGDFTSLQTATSTDANLWTTELPVNTPADAQTSSTGSSVNVFNTSTHTNTVEGFNTTLQDVTVHVSIKMHDNYSSTNTVSPTSPIINTSDLTAYTNISGFTETTAQLPTDIPATGEDGPCILPLPCPAGRKVANIEDCQKYFECNSTGNEWLEMKCHWSPNRYFDNQTETCAQKTTAICQKECPVISLPSTTSSIPVVMSTTVPFTSKQEQLSTKSAEATTETEENVPITTQDEETTTIQTTEEFGETTSTDQTTSEDKKMTTEHPGIVSSSTTSEQNVTVDSTADSSLPMSSTRSDPDVTSEESDFTTDESWTTESTTIVNSENTTSTARTTSMSNQSASTTEAIDLNTTLPDQTTEVDQTFSQTSAVENITGPELTTSGEADGQTSQTSSGSFSTPSSTSNVPISTGETSTTTTASTSSGPTGSNACQRQEPCPEGNLLPDPTDCKKFYSCIKRTTGDTMWQRRPCTGSFRFDQFDLACTSNADVRCHPGCQPNSSTQTPPSVSSSTTSAFQTTESPEITESSNSESSTAGSSTGESTTLEDSLSNTTVSGSSTTSKGPTSGRSTSTEVSTATTESTTAEESTKPVTSGDTTAEEVTPAGLNSTVVDETSASGSTSSVTIGVFSTVIPAGSTESGLETSDSLLNITDSTVSLSTESAEISPTEASANLTSESSGTTSGEFFTSGLFEGSTESSNITTETELKPTTETVGSILDHSIIVVGSEDALEGQDFQIQCSFVVDPPTVPFTLTWYLDDSVLKPSDRIRITQQSPTTRQISSLTFRPIHYRDSGQVKCQVELSSAQIPSIENMPVDVLPRPTITVNQQTITSQANQPISIQCESHVASSSHPEDDVLPVIQWYKNDQALDASGPEEILEISDTIQQLTVRVTEDVDYSCSASNKAGESGLQTCSVTVLEEDSVYCDSETYLHVNWTMTAPGDVNIQPCPRHMIGEATRPCYITDGEDVKWGEPNLNHCVDEELVEIFEEVERIEEGIGGTKESLEEITAKLQRFTNVTTPIAPGNINVSAESLDVLAHVRVEDTSVEISEEELFNVVNTISNLLHSVNDMAWDDLQQEDPMLSVTLMWTVDSYLDVATQFLPDDSQITVQSENVVLQADKFKKSNIKDMTYPKIAKNKMEWMDLDTDAVSIQKETLESIANSIPGESIALSSSYYKNINRLLPNYNPNDTEAYLNSKVLAMSVLGLEHGAKLEPPIHLEFVQNKNIYENETGNCTYWDFAEEMWSTEGCVVVQSNASHTSCQCNHLTNFAVLVSKTPVTGKHAYILSIISIVGCVISIGGMVLTILIYVSIWKHVKSHHAVVLINLCIALIIANLIFVAGVNRTSVREICISVAVLLHYFYLAAFFLMLAEGIQLMLYIIYVFHVRRKRETAALIVLGWVIPAVIVAVCLGINKTEGYGTDDYCWLDSDSWLFWVFIVPAGIIVMVNIIICICVLRRISTSKIHQIDKSRHQKVKSALWNIIVVMPILGITWLFGIFSVNNDILAFQYVFAVSNSLQGLFIFIFHALCNKKAIGRKNSSSGSTMVRDTVCSRLGSSPTQTTSSLMLHFVPGKKGRYHIKSSVRTQRSRLKSDSSGKNSNKSSKSFKSLKDAFFGGSKTKKKNSLSNSNPESPHYDEIPADFLTFDDHHLPTHKLTETNSGKLVLDNEYTLPRDMSQHRHNDGGYANPSFLTFNRDPVNDPNMIDLSISENNNSEGTPRPIKKMTFLERLNSVNEMRTEEYMDVKLNTDNVRFRDSPRHSPRNSPFLPRSTPFLARNTTSGQPVKSQTSFNC